MIQLIGSAVFVVVMIFSPACSQRKSSSEALWSIQLITSGGFAGRGDGNVMIASDGHLRYEKPGVSAQSSSCEGRLSQEDLHDIGALITESKPGGWQVTGLDIAAPDAFKYVLSLKRGNESFKVTWYDNTEDHLPADLKKLYARLKSVKEKQAAKCDGR